MSKAYQRADALQRFLMERAEKQRTTKASRCQEIIMKLKPVEDDLRKEIPGQLDLQDKK